MLPTVPEDMEDPDESGFAAVSLKNLKEKFVSDLHGSTMLEIVALSAIVPAFVILRQLFSSYSFASMTGNVRKADRPEQDDKGRIVEGNAVTLAKDLIVVGLPTLACLTFLADWIYILTAISLCITVVAVTVVRRAQWQMKVDSRVQQSENLTNLRHTSLSSFRFTMMLVTCISILAVDFNIFPRRYAKTETYGTGLMDVGVGSFIAANGLVSRQARGFPPSKFGGVLRNTSPLLVLGLSRLIFTKGVDYQEHVAEYGIHWNFFFTLAAVALLTSSIRVPTSWCAVLGTVILAVVAVYQGILSCGLNEYLLSSERGPGLISLNKEGVYSIFGYWSIYLISVQLGRYLLSLPTRVSGTSKHEGSDLWWTGVHVWLLDAMLWVLALVADKHVEQISRRMCNLAYVMFVFAMNLEVIAIFLTVDLLMPSKQILLLQIFDRNMLPIFLWGNILTGVVNMTVNTISAPPTMAFLILSSYLAALVGGMATVEILGLNMKFW